jgi:hypothetical protein
MLTGRTLDRRVAEDILGYDVVDARNRDVGVLYIKTPQDYDEGGPLNLPRYSDEIQWAWHVVEELRHRKQKEDKHHENHHWGFELFYMSDEEPPEWSANFLTSGGRNVEAVHENVCVAICRAGLYAVEK